MRRSPLVFLDANILFSAALGGPSFALLLELADTRSISLVTSPACVREAETNLERKRPTARPVLADPAPAAIDENPAIAAAYDDARLNILRSLERGEIDVDEAGRRLESLDGGEPGEHLR